MGAKRKCTLTKGDERYEFESFAKAAEFLDADPGDLNRGYTRRGSFRGWTIEAGEVNLHGMRYTHLYNTWNRYKFKCTSNKAAEWHLYGGAGIRFYDGWAEFPPFAEWAKENGYKEGMLLRRKDASKDFTPDNCFWVKSKGKHGGETDDC